jgi:hypothetical protein
MNMMLLPVRGFRISGTVVDSGGRPLTSGTVSLSMPLMLGAMPMFIGSNVKPDGTFSLSNVISGEYVIRTTIGDPITGERAVMPVTVAGADLTDVALVAVKSSVITGRIVVDRAATAAIKPSEMRLSVLPARPEDEGLSGGGAPAQIKDDLTFQINTWPGRLVLTGISTTPGWIVNAVRLNGADVTDAGFDVGASPLAGLEVEITNNAGEVSGNALDATGPTRNAWVLVFAQNREKWRAPSRNIVAIRPDPTNLYRARGLRAGAYYAVAVPVDALEPGEWSDADLLDRLRPHAVAFEVAPGEHKTLDLTLTRFER